MAGCVAIKKFSPRLMVLTARLTDLATRLAKLTARLLRIRVPYTQTGHTRRSAPTHLTCFSLNCNQ